MDEFITAAEKIINLAETEARQTLRRQRNQSAGVVDHYGYGRLYDDALVKYIAAELQSRAKKD